MYNTRATAFSLAKTYFFLLRETEVEVHVTAQTHLTMSTVTSCVAQSVQSI